VNRGLIAKAVREVWRGTLLFALALWIIQILLAYMIPKFAEQLLDQWMKLEFVQRIFAALLGTQAGAAPGPDALAAIAWAHPIVLALVWAQAIMVWTRVPAGEIDRGTIDVLLALPVNRTRIVACEAIVGLTTGLLLITLVLAGNVIGRWSFDPQPRDTLIPLLHVSANLYALYVAVGGITCLVSSLSDRRGRAVGVVFGILIASYFLNSIAALNATASKFSFLNVLHYYRPLRVLQGDGTPVRDVVVLIVVGVVLGAVGWIAFARRDIHTV
jgi:ABC-2 type transport system permease protein